MHRRAAGPSLLCFIAVSTLAGCAHRTPDAPLATFGALDHPEPLVWLADHPREAVPIRQYDVPAIRLVRRRDGAPDMSA